MSMPMSTSMSMRSRKFVVDRMLGKLARWLRILGYDTLYPDAKDEELIEMGNREGRTLITRDKELALRCGNSILITTFTIEDQLGEMLKNGLRIDEKEMFTRCTLCNSVLQEIDKNNVQGKIPQKSFENNEKFWYCKNCDKYYWKGKHWVDIKKKIEKTRVG